MVHSPASQRGAAALIVTQLLLFAMALLALFVHRGTLFEQRTAANQVRAARAFEAAEAGLEWAIAMLNAAGDIDTSCEPGAGGTSFRDRYVPAVDAGGVRDFQPLVDVRPGCSIDGTALDCSCPMTGSAALAGDRAGFMVSFADVTDDPQAIELNATGCTNAGSACASGSGDGLATVRVILKRRAPLRAVPAAALTSGSWTEVCGAFAIANRDARARGQLVDAGSRILIGQATYAAGMPRAGEAMPPGCVGHSASPSLETLPGTPAALAMVAADDDLHLLSSSHDTLFPAIFGMPLAQFRTHNASCGIAGNDATANALAVIDKHRDAALKCRAFIVDGPLRFTGEASLGSAERPVVIVSTGSMRLEGRHEIWGLLYAESAEWGGSGGGSTVVHGAAAARQSFRNAGSGSIDYDARLLETLLGQDGRMVRVPGSWRDF